MQIGDRYQSTPRSKSLLDKKLVACYNHSRWETYQEPCFDCGQFCNCDLKGKYPDVLVVSLDRQTVHLNSIFVRASVNLKNMVKARQKRGQVEVELNQLQKDYSFEDSGIELIDLSDDQDGEDMKDDATIEVIEIDDNDEDEGMNTSKTGLLDYNTKVMDLRKPNNVPTFGITAKMLMMVQKYLSLHLEQVDQTVEKEYRARNYFATSLFPRPKKERINPFGFEDWEEEFFDIRPQTMMELVQAKNELFIWDLHFAVEKWTHLFRGHPVTIEQGLIPKGFKEEDKWDWEDFMNENKKVSNFHKQSTHGRPDLYYTKCLGHIFPRRLVHGSTRGAATNRVAI